jgi:basic amino acid/polyamine antiporter, APA family
LPQVLGDVHDRTGTPLIATGIVIVMTIACALIFSLERLAEVTSLATLATFALVNLSLLRIRIRKIHSPARHVRVPLWVPALGLVTCIVMIGTPLLR